jgi:EAL domain-containing protein (putative c-di-GMP-specific phosphodiesterase class I)
MAMYAAKSTRDLTPSHPARMATPSVRAQTAGCARRSTAGLAPLYQPVIDATRGRMVGAEALIRWRHPELGLMLPAQFLGVAEESQLIVSIGEWVLRSACEQAARWQRSGHEGFRIAVNVSSHQFQSGQFVAMVRDALRDTGLRPDSLELEITERSLLSGGQRTLAQFAMLRGLGVRMAIDDFGTGYSALAYLKQLPVDVLKIDQSFVRAVATDPADATITSTIVMACALDHHHRRRCRDDEQMQLLVPSCNRTQGHRLGPLSSPRARDCCRRRRSGGCDKPGTRPRPPTSRGDPARIRPPSSRPPDVSRARPAASRPQADRRPRPAGRRARPLLRRRVLPRGAAAPR